MGAIRKTPPQDAFAATDAVEIKVTIRPDQELRAERAMQVNEDTADVRLIYFYDTPKLNLFESGIALRARLVKGDDDDSTVKFRPVGSAGVPEDWRRRPLADVGRVGFWGGGFGEPQSPIEGPEQ